MLPPQQAVNVLRKLRVKGKVHKTLAAKLLYEYEDDPKERECVLWGQSSPLVLLHISLCKAPTWSLDILMNHHQLLAGTELCNPVNTMKVGKDRDRHCNDRRT